jgi:N-carbamoyl-L-amino-acid hydrolase
MSDNRLHVDGARVLADLNALRAIGAYKTGVHKPTFSEPHMRSLQWLAERLPEAGLTGDIDGIGNVLGTSSKTGPKLLAGSHLESQNFAGWLDGPLGVVYALEAARVTDLTSAASPRTRSTPRATVAAAGPCGTPCARSALPNAHA